MRAADRHRAFSAADAGYKAYSRGDYADAIRKATEAIGLAPANSDYRRLLATAQAAMASATRNRAFQAADSAYKANARGDHARAVADAQEAVRLSPQDRAYRRLLVDRIGECGAVV